MGIEAISRGAVDVRFVEKDQKVVKTLLKNLLEVERRLDEEPMRRLFTESFSVFLEREIEFDLVYFDPPWRFFEKHKMDEIPFELAVKEQGHFLVEHTKKLPRILPDALGSLHLIDSRKYGQSQISIYKKTIPKQNDHLDESLPNFEASLAQR
jgi:16S rRNA (guanine966-N2)-methyltransferase